MRAPAVMWWGALVFLAACAPANLGKPASDFHPAFQAVPGLWLHLETSLDPQHRLWATDAVTAPDGHYWVWSAAFGSMPSTRQLDVYVHDAVFVVGPQRLGVGSYTVEDPVRARDQIHCVIGHKGILGRRGTPSSGLLAELHQVSLSPRDYWRQDAGVGWDVIFGSMTQGTTTIGLIVGPTTVVLVQQQATQTQTTGLLDQVLNDLDRRR